MAIRKQKFDFEEWVKTFWDNRNFAYLENRRRRRRERLINDAVLAVLCGPAEGEITIACPSEESVEKFVADVKERLEHIKTIYLQSPGEARHPEPSDNDA